MKKDVEKSWNYFIGCYILLFDRSGGNEYNNRDLVLGASHFHSHWMPV